mmetsp:Transcript_46812/g.73939  ORF Transcript_46812/g.73939 Transcript_46812/m.73939 type:complete len:230 (-) Transcript_46812:465-1154(-)
MLCGVWQIHGVGKAKFFRVAKEILHGVAAKVLEKETIHGLEAKEKTHGRMGREAKEKTYGATGKEAKETTHGSMAKEAKEMTHGAVAKVESLGVEIAVARGVEKAMILGAAKAILEKVSHGTLAVNLWAVKPSHGGAQVIHGMVKASLGMAKERIRGVVEMGKAILGVAKERTRGAKLMHGVVMVKMHGVPREVIRGMAKASHGRVKEIRGVTKAARRESLQKVKKALL